MAVYFFVFRHFSYIQITLFQLVLQINLTEFFMKTSIENFKVSFYLKDKNIRGGLCPVMGRITIGKELVRFSCKLEANSTLWNARAGRLNGKSHHARMVNREIDKINVAVNARYKEIISLRGLATADEVKNSYQGTAMSQETLLNVSSM